MDNFVKKMMYDAPPAFEFSDDEDNNSKSSVLSANDGNFDEYDDESMSKLSEEIDSDNEKSTTVDMAEIEMIGAGTKQVGDFFEFFGPDRTGSAVYYFFIIIFEWCRP